MVKDRKKSSSSAAKVVVGVPTPPVGSSAAEKGTKLKRRRRNPDKKKKKIVEEEQVGKAHAHELEKQIVKLRKELDSQDAKRDALEARANEAEKKLQDYTLKLENEELMKVESEATSKVEELMEDMEDDDAPLEMKDDDAPMYLYELYEQISNLPEGSKTLYATNLRHPEGRRLVEADFEEFFREVGKVVNVQIQLDPKKIRIVHFAKIEFESHDVANEAMKMHGRWFLTGPVELNGEPKLKTPRYNNTDCTNERPIISCFGFGKTISGYKLKSELKEYFSSVGEVVSVFVTFDENALSLGCAYLEFKNEESFYRAFDLNGTLFLGSPLQVRRAKVFVTSN